MVAYFNTVLAGGSLKSALLYFDHVVPVNLSREILPRKDDKSYRPKSYRPLPDLQDDILPPDLCCNASFCDQLILVNTAIHYLTLKEAIKRFGFAPRIGDLSDSEYALIEETAADAFCQFVNEFSLGNLPLDVGRGMLSDEPEAASDTVISLASLNLIDAEQCSWEQIREFRHDIEARDRLRRLRLFAYANYQGKAKDFVEDDILTRIADHEAAVKKWGFETAQGALNMLLTSKVIGGALAGSLVSTFFGAPTIAVVAAASGGALEIGRITLEITKQRLALRSLMRESPVSFISYAREKLQDGPQR